MKPKNEAAASLGRIGGKSTSAKKRAAVAENLKKAREAKAAKAKAAL